MTTRGTSPLRYGIIGTGMMGVEHLLNLRLFPDVRVTRVADPTPQSREWARGVLGDAAVLHEDYRELIDADDVDAVVIATPNHTHAAVLRDALRTGKHILVEKPLCTTLEDCREVAAAAREHPGVFWVGMEYRYMAPVARLIEEVHGGAVGRLRMLAIREHRFPFLPKVGDWNRFARNTGGTLVEKCCHFFDLMRLIVGTRPLRVFASGGQDVNHLDESYAGERPDILDNAFVIVDFEGGLRALLDLCMFAEGSRHQEEIAATGDAGKVECFLPSAELVVGRRRPKEVASSHVPVPEHILKAGFHHGSTYYQHAAFQRAIREGTPPAVSAEDGLWAVALGLAAERSAKERRPVDLTELSL
jgi:myo-inositol 2-dehydrogenase / D-chiro-inositol 1-dehydrogenase